MYLLIIFLIVLLAALCSFYMLYKLTSGHDQYPLQKLSQKLALAFTGVISFTVDTIGVGSFAIDIAIAKTLKLVKDNELPDFVNGAQVIPGTIEAVFLVHYMSIL